MHLPKTIRQIANPPKNRSRVDAHPAGPGARAPVPVRDMAVRPPGGTRTGPGGIAAGTVSGPRSGDPEVRRRPQRGHRGTKAPPDRTVVRITTKPGETFTGRTAALAEGAARRKAPGEIALGSSAPTILALAPPAPKGVRYRPAPAGRSAATSGSTDSAARSPRPSASRSSTCSSPRCRALLNQERPIGHGRASQEHHPDDRGGAAHLARPERRPRHPRSPGGGTARPSRPTGREARGRVHRGPHPWIHGRSRGQRPGTQHRAQECGQGPTRTRCGQLRGGGSGRNRRPPRRAPQRRPAALFTKSPFLAHLLIPQRPGTFETFDYIERKHRSDLRNRHA